MKALTIDAHGGLDRVQYRTDVAVPALSGPGDVRVRITAAAINHLDLFVVEGLPGVTIRPPWVLGADGAGVIDDAGAAVTHVGAGDRVVINPGIACRQCEYCQAGEQPLCVKFGILGEHHPGTFAEYVVVPGANVRRLPAGVDDGLAAAYLLVTMTAWRMLVTRATVRAGERVLIQGIGSPVSIAALQIAKARGAAVWVTSSSDAKLERARAMGADETLNYRTQDVGREVRARTGKRGVDVVVDNAGAGSWASSLGALGRRGRLVTCGATTGPMVETDVRRLFWNQWTIMGSTMGNDAEFEAVLAELAAGRLTMPIDAEFPLARGREAMERLAAGGQFGKIVLRV